jgi:hypothetical protein
MMIDYTLVVGVDQRHLRQLAWTWPTWRRHKPSLLDHPMLAFHDESVTVDQVRSVVDHPKLATVPWPPEGTIYPGMSGGKWSDPQRYKMLAGFVYVPTKFVMTQYWLKLDTDVVATGQDDWVEERWFDGQPAIVSHPWSFTKPPDQIDVLDRWADRYGLNLPRPSLHISPKPGADRVGHKRVISWCGFFKTSFTARAAALAQFTCGCNLLPVPSQDGFLWYIAQRLGLGVERVQMKRRGWQQWSTDGNVRRYSEEAIR